MNDQETLEDLTKEMPPWALGWLVPQLAEMLCDYKYESIMKTSLKTLSSKLTDVDQPLLQALSLPSGSREEALIQLWILKTRKLRKNYPYLL